jgi:glutamate-1-semialdehyde 2,1-aminomutase
MTNGGVIPPDPGYLQAVRDLTKQYNVLLIMDEVKIGARIAPGGGVEKYGITPDLITLGQGYRRRNPLGAFGGRKDLMDMISPLGPAVHYGTYNANPLTAEAGLACLTKVLTPEKYVEMDRLSLKYAEGMESIINRLGLPACVTIEGPLGGIQFVPEKPHTYRQANKCDKKMWSEYWYGMLCKGVIPMGSGWFEEYSISAAHTEKDIDETLDRTDDVLGTIKKNMESCDNQCSYYSCISGGALLFRFLFQGSQTCRRHDGGVCGWRKVIWPNCGDVYRRGHNINRFPLCWLV